MWLPGYERHEYPGLAGKSFQFTHNPKGCMHTTEGGSIAGAMSAYGPYPPHLIYDWRNRRGVQHVRLDRAAYSAMDGNDDDYMIQVELVGFAAETRDWPEQALRNIAVDVVAPLERYFQIPRRIIGHGFKDGRDGIRPYISSAESPIRLSWSQLRDFAGWLGHQHLPAPDTHWDPGALPMARILGFLSEEDDMYTDADRRAMDDLAHRVAALTQMKPTTAGGPSKGEAIKVVPAIEDLAYRVEALVNARDTQAGGASKGQAIPLVATVKAIAADVAAIKANATGPAIDYDQLAAALARTGVFPTIDAIADEMDRRARDNDHTTGPTS